MPLMCNLTQPSHRGVSAVRPMVAAAKERTPIRTGGSPSPISSQTGAPWRQRRRPRPTIETATRTPLASTERSVSRLCVSGPERQDCPLYVQTARRRVWARESQLRAGASKMLASGGGSHPISDRGRRGGRRPTPARRAGVWERRRHRAHWRHPSIGGRGDPQQDEMPR